MIPLLMISGLGLAYLLSLVDGAILPCITGGMSPILE